MKPLFLCHGGPTLVVERNSYTDYLKDLGPTLKPDAIVIFSAHWEKEVTHITYTDTTYETIHDFYGFPKELFEIQYPAKGSKAVASKVAGLFEAAGVAYTYDESRGLDHGTWDVLKLMFPEADIPVVALSVNPFLPKDQQIAIGEALRSLGEENILVIGSGSTVHNLGTVQWDSDEVVSWAKEFDDWLLKNVEEENYDNLYNYRKLAPNAAKAVPREEHLVPLYLAMGAGANKPVTLHHSYAYGTLSYIALSF